MPEVVYADSFFAAASRLQKRYKHVQDDAETLADQLEAGELPGDRIQGLPTAFTRRESRIAMPSAARAAAIALFTTWKPPI